MTISSEEIVSDFLRELDGWEGAYPLSVFPEPDLKRAAELLKAGGMTLDAISASNMRHVVSKIAPTARDALTVLVRERDELRGHFSALRDICKRNCVETGEPDRLRWEGVWYEGPPATAFLHMMKAVEGLCVTALNGGGE